MVWYNRLIRLPTPPVIIMHLSFITLFKLKHKVLLSFELTYPITVFFAHKERTFYIQITSLLYSEQFKYRTFSCCSGHSKTLSFRKWPTCPTTANERINLIICYMYRNYVHFKIYIRIN